MYMYSMSTRVLYEQLLAYCLISFASEMLFTQGSKIKFTGFVQSLFKATLTSTFM